MTITGAQCLAEMLGGYGVTHVFMVPAVLRRTFAEMERRTSQPQVSLAIAAISWAAIHSRVSNAKPGASPPGYPSQLPSLKQRSI